MLLHSQSQTTPTEPGIPPVGQERQSHSSSGAQTQILCTDEETGLPGVGGGSVALPKTTELAGGDVSELGV